MCHGSVGSLDRDCVVIEWAHSSVDSLPTWSTSNWVELPCTGTSALWFMGASEGFPKRPSLGLVT